MARLHRVVAPNITQHVIQRGNNRMDIFRTPSDFEVYFYALREASVRHRVQIHSYAFMTNHVHAMATPTSAAALAAAMQSVGRRYVSYFNRRYGRTGGMYDGRYRAFAIESDTYWFTCMRYVEFNPVRAGLTTTPEQYRWSSYEYHAFGREDLLVTPHALYLGLGTTPEQRQQCWRAICGAPLTDADVAEMRARVNATTRKVESTHHRGLTPERGVTGV